VGAKAVAATAVHDPARTGRQVRLHLATKAPWADLVNDAVRRLRALAVPSWCSPRPSRQPPRDPRPPGTGDHPRRHSGLTSTPWGWFWG